jgi:hypothetical protein
LVSLTSVVAGPAKASWSINDVLLQLLFYKILFKDLDFYPPGPQRQSLVSRSNVTFYRTSYFPIVHPISLSIPFWHSGRNTYIFIFLYLIIFYSGTNVSGDGIFGGEDNCCKDFFEPFLFRRMLQNSPVMMNISLDFFISQNG